MWMMVATAIAISLVAPGARANMALVDRGHDGAVVEGDTGKPVAGAKVVGKWVVGYSSPAHGGQRCRVFTPCFMQARDG